MSTQTSCSHDDAFFAPIPRDVDLPGIEQEILAFWNRERIFERSLANRARNDAFVFYDGPPFATGLPHYGHLLAGTMKDIVPRYRTMRGNYVERTFGWDCHGLPVEKEIEGEMRITGKRDIEQIGIHLFNEACRSIVLRYTRQWRDIVQRMGRWVDFEHEYRTMDPPYMESIWWVFKQIWDKGLIYEGYKVQPFCPGCSTPLSNFEVNQGYADKKDPSITVTCPLQDEPNVKLLVWTTTPWTLPSNVALAVHRNIEYVKVRDGDTFYVLAKDRLPAYYKNDEEYDIVETFTGERLAGSTYVPVFDYFSNTPGSFFTIVCADFVSTEDGTGIVHLAPGFGEDDFITGRAHDLPFVCPVNEEGRFTREITDHAGEYIFEANDAIVRQLKEKGRLVYKTTITHRYPFCYRCDTPLIYKAITTWFMAIAPLKDNMRENNSRIRWVPAHLKEGRFGKGIDSAPDWNIARNRYWGAPIPVWRCNCGHTECVGSIEQFHTLAGKGDAAAGRTLHRSAAAEVTAEIKNLTAADLKNKGIPEQWLDNLTSTTIPEDDLHRHVIERLSIPCPQCGATMQRVPEVLDCWFESGSMPYAQLHYPFAHADDFSSRFPADFIAEGLDQTRGWFYTLTVVASALFGSTAFKNVVVNGIILSEDGKKLSKRLKNYVPPREILDQLGADALRLFLINSPAVKGEELRFSNEGVLEMYRSILLPFWNAYSFFITYANIDAWQPPAECVPAPHNELDKWILSLLENTTAYVRQEMDGYNLYRVVPHLVGFIDNLTNWYIRRSRRRFWKSENDRDKNEAYEVLYYVLREFSKVMAPFLPFLTDAVYRNLSGARHDGRIAQSVHLTDFPEDTERFRDRDLETKMEAIRSVVAMGRALRSRFEIKIRQPLATLTVIIGDTHKRALIAESASLIADELNVKQVVFEENEDTVVSLHAKPNYKKLGKIYKKSMKEAAPVIEAFTQAQIAALRNGETIDVKGHPVDIDDIDLRREKRSGIEVETRGEITVAIDTEITPALRKEGLAREFVNRVQNTRKEHNFDVADRITITCAAPADIRDAVQAHETYVCNETLAASIQWQDNADAADMTTVDINGRRASLLLARQ
jgi:isoleucyl-tRNA synthetase